MEEINNTSRQGLGELARKYGAAGLLIFANQYFIAIVFSFVVSFIVALMPNASELSDAGTDAGYALLMLMNEVCVYTVPLIAFSFIFGGEDGAHVPGEPRYRRFFGETPLLFIAGWTAGLVGSWVTNRISVLINDLFSVPRPETAFSGVMPQNLFRYCVFAFCVCIIAPLCEEIIYRKLMLDPLRKYSDSAAALISSLFFALSHFNFSQFLYSFGFGFFLAVIAIRSGSIVPSLICHIINNIIAVISTYLPDTLGSDQADAFFSGLSGFVGSAYSILLYVGLPVIAAAFIFRLCRLTDSEGLRVRDRLAVIFREPVFIVSVVLMLGGAVAELF